MRTKIIYNGVDISNDIAVLSCVLTDSCCSEQDYLKLSFASPNKEWEKWQPQINDVIEVKNGIAESGKMYVNERESKDGKYTFTLLSTKADTKVGKTRIRRDVNLTEIISDTAKSTGLTAVSYADTDFTYKAAAQTNATDLEFLAKRCFLEGLCVKLYDEKLIIFDEKKLKSASSGGVITPDDCMRYGFADGSGLLGKVTVTSYDITGGNTITYTETDEKILGGAKTFNIRVDNLAQAERFAKNILYNANKKAISGCLKIKYADVFASGSVVTLEKFGAYSGNYYIYKNLFNMTGSESLMHISRIEG